jgi:hypothetical protein
VSVLVEKSVQELQEFRRRTLTRLAKGFALDIPSGLGCELWLAAGVLLWQTAVRRRSALLPKLGIIHKISHNLLITSHL